MGRTGQVYSPHVIDRTQLIALSTATSNSRTYKMDDRDRQCLEDLRVTDSRDDKKRIEETKGGLFPDSYGWILKNVEFRRWCGDEQNRLLWIRGDPGKGK